MNKSKKQIYMVYCCNVLDQPLHVIMATTSVTKLKQFIIKKLKEENEYVFYGRSRAYSINQQIENFKFDFKNHHRNIINENLYGLKYDYVYDGEEQ